MWTSRVPLKVRICNWRARLDRLATMNNLVKKGMQITDDLCRLCKEDRETADHVFINCRKARDVRRAVNS